MSDIKLRDQIEIINLTKQMRPPKPYRDPIILYSVSLLIVAVLSFYGGFKAAVDNRRVMESQATMAISRACIEYVSNLRPRTVQLGAPIWIVENCGRIADMSLKRINGMRAGVVR